MFGIADILYVDRQHLQIRRAVQGVGKVAGELIVGSGMGLLV
ncbi:MAG: hypothetical protein ABWW70_04280 [Thermoproteota archaeon]